MLEPDLCVDTPGPSPSNPWPRPLIGSGWRNERSHLGLAIAIQPWGKHT